MNKRHVITLIAVIALPIVLLIGMERVVAARPGARALPAYLVTADNPADVADIIYAWIYDGDQSSAQFGYSVATAGDVNGDGYDDVIVGARFYSHTLYKEGAAFVFYGSRGGLSVAPDWQVGGGQTGSRFGAAVGTAGDVNDDGYDDVIVGAPEYTLEIQSQSREGRAYVYYGSASGLSATPDWIIEGDQGSAFLGDSVGTAGDVNGDGYDDIIIGAPNYTNGETNEGRVYVYLGFGSGQTTSLFWFAESDQTKALFGSSVGTAGDVNNDTYDDIIVGAPYYDGGESDMGAAFVFYGSTDVLSATSVITCSGCAGAHFGASVGTAGDVNGDGYDEVIVGAPAYSNTVDVVGAAFVFHGSASGLNSITPTWMFAGTQDNAYFGISVGTAGDTNSDAYDDVIIGEYQYWGDQKLEGAIYVFCGSGAGLGQMICGSGQGNKQETWFGYSAGTAGDVNDDGYDDVIVGAPEYMRDNKTKYGRVFVYHGKQDPFNFHIYLPLVVRIS